MMGLLRQLYRLCYLFDSTHLTLYGLTSPNPAGRFRIFDLWRPFCFISCKFLNNFLLLQRVDDGGSLKSAVRCCLLPCRCGCSLGWCSSSGQVKGGRSLWLPPSSSQASSSCCLPHTSTCCQIPRSWQLTGSLELLAQSCAPRGPAQGAAALSTTRIHQTHLCAKWSKSSLILRHIS